MVDPLCHIHLKIGFENELFQNLTLVLHNFINFRYPKEPVSQPIMNRPSNHVEKVIPNRRPPAPPVRIDTCIGKAAFLFKLTPVGHFTN